jgi:hypothetical protein
MEKFDSNGCAHGAREAGRRRRCIALVRRSAPRRRRTRETPRRRRKHRGGDVRARQRAGSGRAQSACLVWRRRCLREKVRRVKCGGGSHLCGGASFQGTLECAQGTRGGRRVRSALEWQGEAQTPNGLVVCPTVLGVE